MTRSRRSSLLTRIAVAHDAHTRTSGPGQRRRRRDQQIGRSTAIAAHCPLCRACSAAKMRRAFLTWRCATALIYRLRVSASHRAHDARVSAARRCLPASVFGPVLIPPWFLQRPLASAFAAQGLPLRVLAPHLRRVRHRPAIGFQSSDACAQVRDAPARTGPESQQRRPVHSKSGQMGDGAVDPKRSSPTSCGCNATT